MTWRRSSSPSLREPDPPLSTVQLMLSNFTYRLSFATEDQAAIRASLLQLLHMIFENIAVLSVDDRWLRGRPNRSWRLYPTADAAAPGRCATAPEGRDLQTDRSQGAPAEAQEQMKDMLATFIERLAQMTASSTTYHETMERCADLIGKASSIQEIAPVLAEVMSATRAMALDTKLTHTELQDLRERTDAKHAEVARLQQELERASTQARHDPLTAPSTARV